ncbi:MAG: tetratricopeptide repeat protein [Deltaproteobacteria bacterium]|nr:tetratricopeptide repeat protein [Deltaproteobacteria bacterium]
MLRWLVALAAALLLVASSASSAHAQSFDTLLREGNEAFFRGDYVTAAARYEALGEAGVDDPDVHYNLGASYARQGLHGRAIVELERAVRLRPSDEGARAALDASRAIVGRRHAEREGEAVVEAGAPFGEALFSFLSEDALAGVVLALELALSAVLLALFFVKHERARIGLGVAAPLFLVLLAATGLGLLSRRGAFAAGPTAIVVRDDAALREGPREEASVRARALEGERAEVLSRDGAWARVRLGGGREGWVVAEDVVEL